MKTKNGHNLKELLREALESAEILERSRVEIDYEEGFVWTRRADGESRFETGLDDGERIAVGSIHTFDDRPYEVTSIASIDYSGIYPIVIGMHKPAKRPPDAGGA